MKPKKVIESIIFGSKWFLIIFYFGLILTMCTYTWEYLKEIVHLLKHLNELTRDGILVYTLELVDIVMIANLIKMIITGSYNSFVDKNHSDASEKVSSGLLKVKMSTSLIGVSSIHLLQTFINAENVAWPTISKQLWIHSIFLIGALILAIINYLHEKTEINEELVKMELELKYPSIKLQHSSEEA